MYQTYSPFTWDWPGHVILPLRLETHLVDKTLIGKPLGETENGKEKEVETLEEKTTLKKRGITEAFNGQTALHYGSIYVHVCMA